MCVDQPWSHRITIMHFGEADLQSNKQSLDLFISYRSGGGGAAFVHICSFHFNSCSEENSFVRRLQHLVSRHPE